MVQNVKSPYKEFCVVKQNCRSHPKVSGTGYNIVINNKKFCKLRDKISDHLSNFSTLWDKLVNQTSKILALWWIFSIRFTNTSTLETNLWYSGHKTFDTVRQTNNWPLKLLDTVRQSFDSALKFFDIVGQTCTSNLKLCGS